MDSLNLVILIPKFCIFLINLDLQIVIKSNGVYSSLFWINVEISRPSRRMWWLLLTLKYKDNRRLEPCKANDYADKYFMSFLISISAGMEN
jgi:hypothetical protein